MKVKEYCKYVDAELVAWKAKIYDVMSKMDKLSTGEKQRMFEEINGLHIVMAELEERVEKLRTECPVEWKPEQETIQAKLADLSSRYNDAAGIFFDYSRGG